MSVPGLAADYGKSYPAEPLRIPADRETSWLLRGLTHPLLHRAYVESMERALDPEMRRRVMQARVARLATVRPDGYPHIVPITFAFDRDTIVTAVDHKPKTTSALQRLQNIEARPVVSFIVDHYEDDWSRLWWVRGDGTARIVREGPVRERAIERLAEKYPPYRDNAPQGPVIVVTFDRWASWSA